MKTKTIEGLNIEDCRVLKEIFIIGDRNFGESTIGQIFYKRKINENYNFIKQKEYDERKENTLLEKLLEGYPKQENYPNDELDDLILSGIKQQYPKSKIKNSLILFNIDLENLEILKNQNRFPSKFYITPVINNMSDFFMYSGKSFESPELDLNIFSNYSNIFMENHSFSFHYDIENNNLKTLLSTIEFE
ncbi:hypothetical protein [Cloacibacterium normanense]